MKEIIQTKKFVKSRTKHLFLLTCMFITFTGFSQEDEKEEVKTSNWDLRASVQSRYIWRGINLGGNSASIQPSITYSKGMFSIGAWGAYSVGSDQLGQEADIYLSISPFDFLSFTVTDYFFPNDRLPDNNYFHQGHILEIATSFSGFKTFPLCLFIATNVIGADKTEDGDQSYSTYIEASYPFSTGYIDIKLFAGAVFGDTGSYYGTNGSGFINLGLGVSKAIKITEKWSLPVDAALIYNPDAENVFITFGFTI